MRVFYEVCFAERTGERSEPSGRMPKKAGFTLFSRTHSLCLAGPYFSYDCSICHRRSCGVRSMPLRRRQGKRRDSVGCDESSGAGKSHTSGTDTPSLHPLSVVETIPVQTRGKRRNSLCDCTRDQNDVIVKRSNNDESNRSVHDFSLYLPLPLARTTM